MAKRVKIPSYEAFLMGESFLNSGKLLAESVEQIFHQRIPRNFGYTIAANHAFGLELYFKCLIAMDGNAVLQVHDLRIQFDDLVQPTQMEIRTSHADIVKNDPDMPTSARKS